MSGRPLALAAVMLGLLMVTPPALAKGEAKGAKTKAPAEAVEPATPQTAPPAAKQNGSAAPSINGATHNPPTTWSTEEIAAARAHCAEVLAAVEAETKTEDPIRSGACGAAAPVRLLSLGRNPQVVLSPAPTLTCDMVASLAKWFGEDVQPLAMQHLGAPVVKIENMSSYSCRNAPGRVAGRLSEHGRANALDIGSFITSTGENATVLADWGPTARAIRAQIAAAAKAAADKKKAAQKGQAVIAPGPPAVPLPDRSVPGKRVAAHGITTGATPAAASGPDALRLRSSQFDTARAAKLGGPKQNDPARSEKRRQTAPAASSPEEVEARRTRFLRQAHAAACKHFGTVLGPEANADHENHFHVDMAERKRSNFCE